MKKFEIVKEQRKFDEIIKTGNFIKNNTFIVYYLKHEQDFPKFGIAVGKKIGNAVTRNKYKRIIRNIVDNNKFLFKKEFDYIIIIKRKCLEMSFDELNNSLSSLINENIKERNVK